MLILTSVSYTLGSYLTVCVLQRGDFTDLVIYSKVGQQIKMRKSLKTGNVMHLQDGYCIMMIIILKQSPS